MVEKIKNLILNELVNELVDVQIQYIDRDKTTLLNENKFTGRILKVDPQEGISIRPDEDGRTIAVIPPSTEACWRDEDNLIHVSWKVFRLQEEREDGQHEWWDWQPSR